MDTVESAIREHWAASERGDIRAEHDIYAPAARGELAQPMPGRQAVAEDP